MGNVLYRLYTNVLANKFVHYLATPPHDAPPRFSSVLADKYQNLAEIDSECLVSPSMRSYRMKQTVDTSEALLDRILCRRVRGKAPDIQKIPDFWCVDNSAVVTQAFRNSIEVADPGVHQFVPFNLFCDSTDELVDHTSFYHFFCGRLLEVDEHPQPLDQNLCDMGGDHDIEMRRLRTIAESSDIQTYLETVPIWCFRSHAFGAFYVNKTFLRSAQAQGLKGFKESSEHTRRDVGHIWY